MLTLQGSAPGNLRVAALALYGPFEHAMRVAGWNRSESVLPAGIPRIAVEMGVTDGWWKYGCAAVVGIDSYGESAPAPVLFKHFGFTPENVADTVRAVLAK